MIRSRRPADERLDEVGRVTAGSEGAPSDGGKVGERPGGLFRGFDKNGGACEEGGDNGVYKVVELPLSAVPLCC